jgi:hypothetical protein
MARTAGEDGREPAGVGATRVGATDAGADGVGEPDVGAGDTELEHATSPTRTAAK